MARAQANAEFGASLINANLTGVGCYLTDYVP